MDSRLRRVIAVVKVRASAHSDELRAFTIDDSGIRTGERLCEQEGQLGGQPTRKLVQESSSAGDEESAPGESLKMS